LFKDCPRCFWLDLNKNIKRPAGIFPSLPSGMDMILKKHFDSFIGKGLPPELKDLNREVKLFDNEELLKVWRSNFKGIRFTDEKGNILRGAVDNILVKGTKLIVLDYKTRGYPLKEDTAAHYQDQMNCYNFLLRKNSYETEDYTYLVFYYPSHITEDGNVCFHTELIKMPTSAEDGENLFKDALACLEGPEPEKKEECEYCSYMTPKE
ncbi:MAG: PD-(D/E)XK nuclease family protein, partial [Nanoarchaeota archaeon]|nr:PD-(D/E)XK nuclease family protein [Nanoarchaeota archaeon]